MYTLGINAAFHDSAACLVRDGWIIAAAEEERFTGIKHGKRPVPFSTWELPFHAIDYCLREAGIPLAEVDHVAYSFDPYLLLGKKRGEETIALPLEPSAHAPAARGGSVWEPLFLSSIVNAPRQLASGAPHHLKARFEGLRHDGPWQWHFVEHHAAHAASAFFVSPFDEAAVLTLDGRGERAATTLQYGDDTSLRLLCETRLPHSLGLLYEELTAYLGFMRSSDEYKVMALASFGKPLYAGAFRKAVRLHDDGTYEITPFDWAAAFGPGRRPGGQIEQRHRDIARSLQLVLEESVLAIAQRLHDATGSENLCLAGGVALNCVLNSRLRDQGPFRRVWVQPAAGDAGTALGAAVLVDLAARQAAIRTYCMEHAALGPSFSDNEILAALRHARLPFRTLRGLEEVTDLLVQDKVVGWFQGRMEFGPRALGSRSILASPLHASMQARLNELKDREDFRPVAPVVLEEEAGNWFAGAKRSPFMLFVYDVLPGKAKLIPAVTHVDGTARIQTLRHGQNPRYHELLSSFFRRTGVPVLVNTSFNTRGRPIVCTPRDALECFWSSPIDALVIGSYLLEKP